MNVLKDLSTEIPDTNSFHWNFDEFSCDDGISLAVGYRSLERSANLKNQCSDENCNLVLFNNWAPCEYGQAKVFQNIDAVRGEDHFDNVLTICPYTAKWRNSNSVCKKYIYSFYPYSRSIVPTTFKKKYDVIYHGGIHGKEHVAALKVMQKYKYRYSSLDFGINRLTRKSLRYATDVNLPFQEKISRISECKISIGFNLIHVSRSHLANIRNYSRALPDDADFFYGLKYTGLFKNWPWVGVLPQFKTRIHEAAISRTVNLVYRDPWNVIEDYYQPSKEFIYFSSDEDLDSKIRWVLDNWDSSEIQDLIESAFIKASRYTTENFMARYSAVLSSRCPEKHVNFGCSSFWE